MSIPERGPIFISGIDTFLYPHEADTTFSDEMVTHPRAVPVREDAPADSVKQDEPVQTETSGQS